MSGRSDLEQAVVNYLKVARSAIRLKHTIAADSEINDVLPKLRVQLEAMTQRGELPELRADELVLLAERMEHYSGADS